MQIVRRSLLMLLFASLIYVCLARAVITQKYYLVTKARGSLTIKQAIERGFNRILIAQGTYVIDNPVIVNDSGSLFLIGGGRLATRLITRWPSKPLFRIQRIGLLRIAGLELISKGMENAPLIQSDNKEKMKLEIQDCFFRGAGIALHGTGYTVIQGSHFDGCCKSGKKFATNGIVLDNTQAELYVIAGNMKNHSQSHVLQLNGHMEVYGTGMQHHGVADIIISSPSPKGAHVIAAVRSEGTNSTLESTFLLVPKSAKKVNVLLKANNFTSPRLSTSHGFPCGRLIVPNTFVNYNARGSVWLVGNFCHANVQHLVEARDSSASIIAIGNALKGCVNPADPLNDVFVMSNADKLWEAYNIFDYSAVSGDKKCPNRRFICPQKSFLDLKDMPQIPDNENQESIPKLDAPKIPCPPPEGFLRSVKYYVNSATCLNSKDDTCYLQKALDIEGANLYFPPGTYKISRPLVLNQKRSDVGGMLLGAGSDVTRIICTTGPALVTYGMAYVTIRGITFVTKNERSPVVSLEWPESVKWRKNPYVATQANNFYDVVFEGGKYGLAIGVLSPRQCSENLLVNSTFRHCHLGLAVGHYNALANVLHGVHFDQTHWNVGFSDEAKGGNWVVLDAVATGTTEGVLYKPSLTRNLYHSHFVSDGPKLLSIGQNLNETILFFDQCKFLPKSPRRPFLDFNAGQGVIFLRSQLSDIEMSVGGRCTASFILSIDCDLHNVKVTSPLENFNRLNGREGNSWSDCARYDDINTD